MPAAGELWQFTFDSQGVAGNYQNVLMFRELATTPTATQLHNAGEAFLAAVAPLMSHEVIYTNITFKQMTPLIFDALTYIPTVTTQGTDSGAQGNSTVAMIMTIRTGVAGKSHRGRFYLPGLSNAHTAENVIDGTYATNAATAASTIITKFGPSGTDPALRLGVYSRVIGGTHPFTVAGWQQATVIDPQPILGNQRRRRLGVGI